MNRFVLLLSNLLGEDDVLLVETVGLLLGAHVVLNVAGEGVLLLENDSQWQIISQCRVRCVCSSFPSNTPCSRLVSRFPEYHNAVPATMLLCSACQLVGTPPSLNIWHRPRAVSIKVLIIEFLRSLVTILSMQLILEFISMPRSLHYLALVGEVLVNAGPGDPSDNGDQGHLETAGREACS